MGDRLQRRPHKVRTGRPSGEAGDQPTRLGVPVRRAEPGQRGHEETPPVESTSRASVSLSAAVSMMPRPSRSHCRQRPRRAPRPPSRTAAAPRAQPRLPSSTAPPAPGLRDPRRSRGRTSRFRMSPWPGPARSSPDRRAQLAGLRPCPREGPSHRESRLRDDPGRGHDSRQDRRGRGEELEQLVVPVAGLEVEEHRPRCVRHVRDVRLAACQLPGEPRIDRPEGELPLRGAVRPRIHSSFVAEKYGIADKTRPRADQIGRQLAQRAAVRRSCQTIAGYTGRPLRRSHTTVVSRWFVIPTAPSSCAPMPASPSAASGGCGDAVPDLLRSCSTHPGSGKCWRDLPVAAPDGPQRFVDDETRRARRALIDARITCPADESLHEGDVDRVDRPRQRRRASRPAACLERRGIGGPRLSPKRRPPRCPRTRRRAGVEPSRSSARW